MTPTERLRAAEGGMLHCYFSRRPFDAGRLGCEFARGGMPPVAQEAVDQLVSEYRRVGRELTHLRRGALTADDEITSSLVEEVIGYEVASLQAASFRYTVSPLPEAGLASQILLFLPTAAVRSERDAEYFVQSCRGIPLALEQGAAELAAGRSSGQLPVRHLVDRSIEQVRQYLDTPLEADTFLRSCALADLSGTGRLASQLRSAVAGEIRPAFARYASELADKVWPTARDADHAGLTWIGGEDTYRAAVREHTSLAVEPGRLHALGQQLISDLQREAVGGAREMGWPGDFGTIRDRLRAARDLRFSTSADMLSAACGAMARAAEATTRWITTLPAATCELREMTPLETRNGVLGRYETAPVDRSRPAVYWLNTAHPELRPRYEIEALTHHESVPGHHIEMSSSQEVTSSSAFRKLVSILPYREGWALHMERMADQMGLYTTNEARLGMLSFALWRACRLVVDTGIHLMRWTRSDAVRFMWANTVLTQQNIENEVDRYIAHPASALGYMVGCLAINELRRKVVSESSSERQNRGFYEKILQHGPLTLSCLSATMGIPVSI